jgi:hexosaminidase
MKRFVVRGLFALVAVIGLGVAPPLRAVAAIAVIPQPAYMRVGNGSYALPHVVTIAASKAAERDVAGQLSDFFRKRGLAATIVPKNAAHATVRLSVIAGDKALGTEGYHLRVARDGIGITANTGAGIFYGFQTLRQLFPAPPATANALPYIVITDRPAYRWRGVMLDVSRHFFPVSFVEQYIDIASTYKLNTFHWHLTDDQGWRIQIKTYPRLTTVGSCGDYDHKLGSGPCRYYTQRQIREVVAYAKKRYVTVIPEIEMPGHSRAATTAYPELACKPIRSDVYCPSETTFAFLQNVLAEVMRLFPSTDIHTGGDEVPKRPWNASPFARSVMKQHHLRNAHELQGWFDRRIERYLNAHGRTMIGWDEILAGGVSKHAVVMSWRGTSGGIVAATRSNDVVMTPDGPLYFDAYQGDRAWEPRAINNHTTLRDVYDYDPAVDALTADQSRHIIGAQANLWTEFIPTQQRAEYRLLPRLLALAEDVWTPAADKDWKSFVTRASSQYARFEAAGITFWIPGPNGLEDTIVDGDSVHVAFTSAVPGAAMYYTTDGSYPTVRSARYAGAFSLAVQRGEERRVRVITVLRSGRVSTPADATFSRRVAPLAKP